MGTLGPMMNRAFCLSVVCSASLCVCCSLRAIELLPADSPVQLNVSAMVDLETFLSERPPPGLLFEDDEVFFNPRLTLFADLHFGDHLSGFVQARLDRGFDPGSFESGD